MLSALDLLLKSTFCVSRSLAHLAKRKRLEWSIGFNSWSNWTLYDVIPRSSCKIRRNDVSEMFSCWERRWIYVVGAWFIVKIGIFCKSFVGPYSEEKTHWMVNWLQPLNQLDFVENDSEFMLSVFHAHFLPQQQYWLLTLRFIDEDASFFHFFHKITNIADHVAILPKSVRNFCTHWAILPCFSK